MRVLKVGGNELSDPSFISTLAHTVAVIKDNTAEPILIIHGGGRAIADLQAQLGLESVKVDGLRVTDLASLSAAEMVLTGHSNKIIVKALLAEGLDAIGISGVDGAVLRCQKKQHPHVNLGYVGEIVEVRTELLQKLAAMNLITVLSPISLGQDGQTYNVNADEAASAVALSIGATQLDFVSNVPGVLQDGTVISQLSPAETDRLTADGIISGGMIPKVQAALEAVKMGVQRARIVDLAGLSRSGGTQFTSAMTAEDQNQA